MNLDQLPGLRTETVIQASLDVSPDVTVLEGNGTAAMPAPKFQAPSRSKRVLAAELSGVVPTRRSSTRSIKRRKFDDELVESSLVKTERGRIKACSPATAMSPSLGTQTGQAHSPGHFTSTGTVRLGPNSDVGLGETGKLASMYIVQSVSATAPVASLQSGSVKSGKDAVRQVDTSTSHEKVTKVNAGKAALSPKGIGGKVIVSRSIAGGLGVTRAVGSRSGVSRSSGHPKSRARSRKARRQKASTPSVKDLGRWKPQDDLALITAVQQTNDLSAVHAGVKFSCRFSLKEIEERWYALLYDPSVSKIAMEAARQLHPETVATIQGKALYSTAEETLLGTVVSTSQPSLENFQNLLVQHPQVFHPARTAKTLQAHWLVMKQYHLLPDQTVQPMPRGDHILNLSDIEDFMNDDEITEGKQESVEQELTVVDRRNKREIRHLEQEMPKWQVLVDSVTGISMPDFDSQTLAVLRGRLVRYLMRSREISLGRSTKDSHVDVDLSLEGPSWKISRRQGIIKLRNTGDFFIANEGKRPILVDGRPVMAGSKQKLCNNSVLEISCLRFTFLINQEVISVIRADAYKTAAGSSGT